MRPALAYSLALLAVLSLFVVHLAFGPVRVPFGAVVMTLSGGEVGDPAWVAIVREVRLPEALAALLVGAGLATCGVLMQTLFANPLAGPSVLGVTSGASLGVAVLMLGSAWLPIAGAAWHGMVVLSAFAGSLLVLLLVLLADRRVGDGITLLILGLMVGYLCSALISVLELAAGETALRGFVLWGMGSFARVGMDELPWLVAPIMIGLCWSAFQAKPLNALLLGERYASSMGVEVVAFRRKAILITGLLAGACTAFCGPIAFIGLATPHVARGLMRSADHRHVLPASMLLGAGLSLACDLVVRTSGPTMSLPLNAVTAFLGVPVVIWVVLSGRRWARMTA
ncbi:MAG: iron ABC transporter permease [Flavobacteriales bacterium]|nr:iron ABC transporter permease [Flavobacteriales bacterium]MBK6755333.1 iron ABC transporter permease [Flavobacteriales bacterium]MBK7086114.1 iron ABC transporter permease [Flavobacteriales bacterium]MBK7269455.1 iron ABC transporter permease [Flavobacteriales bacterium]MBK7753748.1 iron ABC transporter permease [Flavobacteriales bacterium]